MNRYMTVGLSLLAGAALFETALIPGIVIGGAAVLAPKYLPRLRRGLQPAFDLIVPRRSERPVPDQPDIKPSAVAARFGVGQALAKTITFRIIVTTLDFTTNYVVLGELATAAGLSTIGLAAGPLFYFIHETAWNYYGPSGTDIDVPTLPSGRTDAAMPPAGREGFTVSRALAKTVTFRAFATAMDFTTNFVVIGDVATAAGLSAFGFFLGPFVYFGHERMWEYLSSPGVRPLELPPPADHIRVIASERAPSDPR
jgi:uncharacterized membrane protein